MIRILFIGDIYGRCGRNSVRHYLPKLKEKYDLDFIIANGENSTNGKGMSKKVYLELMDLGIDAFTMGNHYLDQKEISEWIGETSNIVRPLNLPKEMPGVGSIVVGTKKGKVRLTNLLGKIFVRNMKQTSPFDAMDTLLQDSKEKIHIVDFHAEATSEKRSLGYYLDGKVSAVIGTHTHIQTADERILANGTAMISDAGFCGAYNSVLGINIEGAIEYSRYGKSRKTGPAKGELEFNGVFLEINTINGQASKIERVNLRPKN